MEIMEAANPEMADGAEHIRCPARRGQPSRASLPVFRFALELHFGPDGEFLELSVHAGGFSAGLQPH
nr:hypothetical protein [uncultured Rhodopila sp.]